MRTRQTIRYGEAFKRQVVAQIETGKFSNATQAMQAYGIAGAQTVKHWLRKYGREDLIPRQIRIVTMQERSELGDLKKRVHALEKALADAYMSGLLKESFLQMACEQLGTDAESFKKKHVTKLSGERPIKPGP